VFVCLATLAVAGVIGALAIPSTRRHASGPERDATARL
jgi:hypothetical protein